MSSPDTGGLQMLATRYLKGNRSMQRLLLLPSLTGVPQLSQQWDLHDRIAGIKWHICMIVVSYSIYPNICHTVLEADSSLRLG